MTTEPRCLAELAAARAETTPAAMAFACGAAAMTYAELDTAATGVADALGRLGIGVGGRVGYLGRNHLGYPVVAVAGSRRRAASVGLNWRLPANELAGVLADAAPAVVFADSEFMPTLTAAVELLAEVGPVPRAVDIGDGGARLADWAAGVAAELPAAADVGAPELDDIAYLIYTSGTTGNPKGVITTNAGLLAHLRTPPPWSLTDAVVLIVSPVFHAVGVVWTAFVIDNGCAGVFIADPAPVTVLAEVEARRVTHTVWVPALLQVLLDHPDRPRRDLSSLQAVIYGASPISVPLLERAFECLPGCALVQGYGMTETTGPVTYLTADEHLPGSPRLATAGRAAPNAEVRIVDLDSGEPVPVGRQGEVQTRSEQLSVGYWRNDEATTALFADGGWLRTGDVGVLDADGYLTLTDRVKDVIVTGGENVYGGEVERVLLTIDGVVDACVVARPSARWGEAVTAVIVRRPDARGAALTAESVMAACREQLAHYKAPTEVHFVDTLPRNPAGKVLRRLVREPFWTRD